MKISALIFDMDGLVLDTEVMARTTWRQAAVDCGFDLHDELFCQLVGRTRVDSNRILSDAFGSRFTVDSFRERCRSHWEVAIAETGIPLKRGVIELLDLLDQHAVPRAIATSTGRVSAERSLSIAGVRERFPVLVTGDQVEHGKPAPDIFLRASEELGVAAAECLVLEDSLHGVVAAHAAGAIPVMVPDIVQPTDEARSLAWRIVESLDDVTAYLRMLGPHAETQSPAR